MPARGRPQGSGNIDWDAVVQRLRRTPDTWVLCPEMAAVSGRTIQTIRRQERRALRLTDGVIRCRAKAWAMTGDQITVTLFLKLDTKKGDARGTTTQRDQ